MPEGTLHLPVFYDTLKTLDQTVAVDYYLPGCPPEADADLGRDRGDPRRQAAAAGLGDRRRTRPSATSASGSGTRRRSRSSSAPGRSFPTRDVPAGAGAAVLRHRHPGRLRRLCPQVNSPCIGCYGPNDGVEDFGARLMSALASVIDSRRPGRDRPDHPRGHSRPGRHASTASAWPAACCGAASGRLPATASATSCNMQRMPYTRNGSQR